MRIGIFIDGTFIPERDGASTRFAHLPTKLAEAGVEVIVFHCFRGWSQLSRISEQPYTTYFFPPNVFYSDISLLKRLVRDRQIDIIQVNDAETMRLIGFPLSSTLKVRTVYEAHYHASTLARNLGLPLGRIESLERLEKDVSRHTDEIITFTEQDRQRWITFSGCDRSRVSVIPFGVQVAIHNLKKRKSQMLFVGNMYYEPNRRAVERIIAEILPLVRSLCPHVRTVVVGDIPDNLKRLCLGAQVEIAGEVPDVTSWLNESLVGLAPISEGSGVRVKILQYLSHGVPVVASTVAAEGLNFPALLKEDNLERYAQLCSDMLNEPHKYESRIHQTLETLRMNYLWADIAKQAVGVYEKVMSRSRKWSPGGSPEGYQLPLWIEEVLAKKRFADETTDILGEYYYGIARNGSIEIFN